MIHIAYPLMFLLLLLPFVVRYLFSPLKGMHGDALHVPFLKDLANINLKSGSVWGQVNVSDSSKLSLHFWELFAVFALLVCAMSRPQWVGEPIRIHSQSRDVLLVMDISNSMEEPDFVINRRPVSRLNAVKKVAENAELFIIIGSKNSSNSRQLQKCALDCGAKQAWLVDDASEINWEELSSYQNIGISAGASAPEHLVEELLQELKKHYENLKIHDIIVADERLDSSVKLKNYFGQNAHLEWSVKKLGETTFSVIDSSDSRLSDDGFIFTLTVEDVKVKHTFNCDLIF